VSLAGNNLVSNLQAVGSRVFALEAFGTVTALDALWTPGYRHAALVPLATYRGNGWIQAFTPLNRVKVVAAMHPSSLCILEVEDRNWDSTTEGPKGVSAANLLRTVLWSRIGLVGR
jgi:hypothetical protein